MSPASASRPASTNWRTRSSPSPSMSIEPRPGEVHDALDALLRALDVDAVRVGLALEPHERRAARRAVVRELPLARAASCASRAPDRRPRGSRRRPCARSPCRRAGRPCARPRPRCAASRARRSSRRRTPARASANGVARPVRPMLTMMSAQERRLLLGRELVRDRPAGRLAREPHLGALARGRRPSRRRRRSRSRASGAARACARRTRRPRRSSASCSMCGFTGQPEVAQPRERLVVRSQRRAARPCTPSWYAKKSRSRDAVTRASFWRRLPAAALRGFANRRSPASPWRRLSSSNDASGMNTSPRTSIRVRHAPSCPSRRLGIDGDRRDVGVTSSPVTPSPRVAPRASRPST